MSPDSSLQSYLRLQNESFLLSTGLSVFLAGLYTMVYFTTVHIHCSRKTAHRRKIILTMTLLYALYIFNIGGTCCVLYWRFIENGAFYSVIEIGLERLETSIAMTPWLCAFLADALMVWRCFQVWDCSWKVVAVPIFLWILEIAAGIMLALVAPSLGSVESTNHATIGNIVSTALAFLTVATTATTTILIAYRIISCAKDIENRTRFRFILEVIIQSSAVYATLFLIEGILSLPVLSSSPNLRAPTVGVYITPFITVVPGLSTTVMVARIGRLPQDATFPTTTSVQISNLQFVINNSPDQSAGSVLDIREPSLQETSGERQELPEKNMV
ncbi:hypothetical protein CVT26_001927 [Gymnopilus dilepis]|uniref:G-protein coupled receptors family 1 profile domain-containing protein n=1 Tax=Gymnopilus dilepis TaxID=231916 RepID=A0A409VRY2_9AGAR|nr:hypothetical protein CVT26_001927 [Gymnopilus dilepis]